MNDIVSFYNTFSDYISKDDFNKIVNGLLTEINLLKYENDKIKEYIKNGAYSK